MSEELWYECVCLDCGATYTTDADAECATCRECDSENVEWTTFII